MYHRADTGARNGGIHFLDGGADPSGIRPDPWEWGAPQDETQSNPAAAEGSELPRPGQPASSCLQGGEISF